MYKYISEKRFSLFSSMGVGGGGGVRYASEINVRLVLYMLKRTCISFAHIFKMQISWPLTWACQHTQEW